MCSTKNCLSMLHVWLITCWKWWIFTFPAEYINSTLGHSSNQIFLDPITFSGCQVIRQLLTIKKTKPNKSPICVYSQWKKCAQLRTLGTPVQKPSYFLSIQYGHEYGHEHELGHGHGHRYGHGTGRMDRPVGSGHDFAGFWRVGSGWVSTSDLLVFYWLFFSTWIDMNLRILHSDWLIFIDI